VNRRSRRTTSLLAAVAAGALVTALLPGSGGADTAPSLDARAASLDRTEHAVLFELYALESSLARAREQAAGLRTRSGALEERAVAAERSAARLVTSAAETSPAPAAKPLVEDDPAGPRTLLVDAVAYHLPGRTASGLPVGPGVVAVDPAVIPLGTRLFVPGYGPAIAADVGYAVEGAMIDLWFATTDAARAWGRRTVTITLYP
jgi:3D (Asp-Asp-Asp) domain-containing protein